MADAINLNNTSPTVFRQTNQTPQQTLAPAVSNPASAAASAPPTAAPNASTPISQTAGAGSAAASTGLGGGVAVTSPGLGGGVANPLPVLGDALMLCCAATGSGSSSAQIPVYATPADLPAITAANVQTFAIVTDIGNGTSGLYVAFAGTWSFVTVVA